MSLNILYEDNDIIKPKEQLEMILPETSFNVSLEELNKEWEYKYPKDFKCSHVLKRYNWESYPIL